MKYKILGAAVLAGVLIATSCSSSDSEDRDSSGSGTTASQAIAASAVPASVAATSSEPATPGTEKTSDPAVTVVSTTTTTSAAIPSTTSASTTSTASSVPAEEPETSEPQGTTSTSTTTSAAPATTTSSTTTTTVVESPAVVREQAGLRPRQRNDVRLPLADSVPRDRYVPGLAAVNLYTEQNESNPASAGQLADLASFLKEIGDCSKYQLGTAQPDRCQSRLPLSRLYQAVEDLLEDLGFTPQNVCGAPAGYSFTDLLKPTREMDSEWRYYTGDAIFTTDRLIELHGGERVNPEANLDFYIRQAVQTAHDSLRLAELLDETEAPQLILCQAWIDASGEMPEYSNAMWYALLTPGVQPQESLLSQGTYHLKEISRNGNMAYVLVCHPTLGSRYVDLAWRDAGYRAEVVGTLRNNGCQANFERRGYIADYETEETIRFAFGERVFSAGDLLGFPRS